MPNVRSVQSRLQSFRYGLTVSWHAKFWVVVQKTRNRNKASVPVWSSRRIDFVDPLSNRSNLTFAVARFSTWSAGNRSSKSIVSGTKKPY